MNLQQQSDECGYALEAFAKVLKKGPPREKDKNPLDDPLGVGWVAY